MHIEVNARQDIKGGESLQAEVAAMVEGTIGRFADYLNGVEVYIADVNGPKGGDDDIQCTIEARPAGRPPIAVTSNAPSVVQAVDAASEKLERSLESLVGKQIDQQRHTPGTGHLSAPEA